MIRKFFKKKPTMDDCFVELQGAVSRGATSTIKEIIEKYPDLLNRTLDKGMTLLHLAAEKQNLSSVACLIDLGIDKEVKDELGYVAKGVAYWHGEYRMGAYTDVCLKIVKRIEG